MTPYANNSRSGFLKNLSQDYIYILKSTVVLCRVHEKLVYLVSICLGRAKLKYGNGVDHSVHHDIDQPSAKISQRRLNRDWFAKVLLEAILEVRDVSVF